MGVFKIADESATTVFGQKLRLSKNATAFFGLTKELLTSQENLSIYFVSPKTNAYLGLLKIS
jgi:hypothetical protein